MLRDAHLADTVSAELEDAANNCGIGVIDAARDVRAASIGPEHVDVVVPEGTAAGHVAGLCLPIHRVAGALACLLALKLIGERGERQHDLVGGGVQRPLAILHVEPDVYASLYQLLERVRSLDGL